MHLPIIRSQKNTAIVSNDTQMCFGTIEPTEVCAKCGLLTDRYCGDCNARYCSLQCNETHAEHLAKCCGNIGDATDPAEDRQRTESGQQAIEARSTGKLVKITCVLGHRLVFVRPAAAEVDAEFVLLANDLAKYAKTGDHLKTMPAIGTVCLAELGGCYQRALVMKRTSRLDVVVAFIDYGNVERRLFTALKHIPEHLRRPKRFATKIALNQITEDLMNVAALEYLYNLMAYETELTIDTIGGIGPTNAAVASLFASHDWVNAKVNELNRRGISLKRDNPTNPITIEAKHMEGKRLPVIIVNNSGLCLSEIVFIHADDVVQFLQNHRRVQAVCGYMFDKECQYTPR